MPLTLPAAGMAGSDLEWANQTVVHPLGLAAVLLLGAATLVVPRKHVMLPFVVMACFVAPAQRLVIAGLDFNFLRLLILFGWVRLIVRRETAGFRWNRLDVLLLCWAVVSAAVFALRVGTLSALVNRLGASSEAVGFYFLFRLLVRSWAELQQAVVSFVVAAIPVAVAFAVERSTGRNLFAFLGGVPEITDIRDGRLRCQGAFAHPILAGCFWASLMPLMAVLWFNGGRSKFLAVLGLTLASSIVVMCASSTPILAVLAGAVGFGAYKIRHHMRLVRWSVLAALVALHLVMKAPVWHLIARVDAVRGSTGWHRFHLIDNFIRRWDEWFVFGTQSTAHWGYGLHDVTNQYVLEGVWGGAASLSLFLAAVVIAFGRVGRLWRGAADGTERLFAWAIGVSLFVHCVNFMGVAYFGQIWLIWYLMLAVVSSITPGPVQGGGRRSRMQINGRGRRLSMAKTAPDCGERSRQPSQYQNASQTSVRGRAAD